MTQRVLTTLAVSLALSASAQANLLTNGSFETGDLSGWTTGPSRPASVVGGMTTTDGAHAAFLGGGYGSVFVEQAFATAANAVYRVELDHGVRAPGTTGNRDDLLTITGAGDLVLLSVAVSSYGAFTSDFAPAFTHYSFEFTAVGAESVLRFETVGYTPFLATFLDNVSVAAVTSVPEPGTYALMALGLLAIGAGAQRRRLNQDV
ncbi:MAG: PEP-CTERM sorting domain-containing protein [Aquabacterium sp.]